MNSLVSIKNLDHPTHTLWCEKFWVVCAVYFSQPALLLTNESQTICEVSPGVNGCPVTFRKSRWSMASTENATNHKQQKYVPQIHESRQTKKTIFLFKLISISRAIWFEGKAKNFKTLKLLELFGMFWKPKSEVLQKIFWIMVDDSNQIRKAWKQMEECGRKCWLSSASKWLIHLKI